MRNVTAIYDEGSEGKCWVLRQKAGWRGTLGCERGR